MDDGSWQFPVDGVCPDVDDDGGYDITDKGGVTDE